VDSVPMIVPEKELEGDMGDAHYALNARLMGQAMRKLVALASESGTTIIFINQLRMNIDPMSRKKWIRPGGKALDFATTIIMDLRRISDIKRGDEIIGINVKCKIEKNKVAPPKRETIIEFYFDEGISKSSELINRALELKILKAKGAGWFHLDDTRKFQGRDNLRLLLNDDKELFKEIQTLINKKLKDKDEKTSDPVDKIDTVKKPKKK